MAREVPGRSAQRSAQLCCGSFKSESATPARCDTCTREARWLHRWRRNVDKSCRRRERHLMPASRRRRSRNRSTPTARKSRYPRKTSTCLESQAFLRGRARCVFQIATRLSDSHESTRVGSGSKEGYKGTLSFSGTARNGNRNDAATSPSAPPNIVSHNRASRTGIEYSPETASVTISTKANAPHAMS